MAMAVMRDDLAGVKKRSSPQFTCLEALIPAEAEKGIESMYSISNAPFLNMPAALIGDMGQGCY